jgi:hypothetical protein
MFCGQQEPHDAHAWDSQVVCFGPYHCQGVPVGVDELDYNDGPAPRRVSRQEHETVVAELRADLERARRSRHEVAHCPDLPTPRRKYQHRLWVCDCGRAWRAVLHFTYADHRYEWEEWLP